MVWLTATCTFCTKLRNALRPSSCLMSSEGVSLGTGTGPTSLSQPTHSRLNGCNLKTRLAIHASTMLLRQVSAETVSTIRLVTSQLQVDTFCFHISDRNICKRRCMQRAGANLNLDVVSRRISCVEDIYDKYISEHHRHRHSVIFSKMFVHKLKMEMNRI